MRTLLLTLLLFAMLLLTAGDAAQAKPSREALAMELTALMVTRSSWDQTIQQTSTAMGAQLPPEVQGKVGAAVRDALPFEEITRFNVRVYATHFDDEELRDLIAFYKSPTGKKFAKKLPTISAEVAAMTGQVMQQRLPGALKKHGLAP